MKNLKLTMLLAILLIAFGCSKEEVTNDSELLEQKEETLQTRKAITPFTYGKVVIEWPNGTSLSDRYTIRNEHLESGYVVGWQQCPAYVNREIWNMDIGCKSCKPFNDPTDDDRIAYVLDIDDCFLNIALDN